jgi:hypothetical protein
MLVISAPASAHCDDYNEKMGHIARQTCAPPPQKLSSFFQAGWQAERPGSQ